MLEGTASFKGSDCIHKVLLFPSSSPSSLQVMVLYREGVLGKLTIRVPECQARSDAKEADAEKEEEEEKEDENEDEDEAEEEEAAAMYCWKKLKVRRRCQFCFRFLDDVVEFKEKYCAIDRKGKLYEIYTNEMMAANVLVSEPIFRGHIPSQRQKLLVVDPTSGELHPVVRECRRANASFAVYKFNEHCKEMGCYRESGKG